MIITNVQVRDTKTETRLEGVASITFDDMIVIHDIKIISNADGGFFLAMPSRRLPNGSFKDIAHPISKEARGAIEALTISCFNYMRQSGHIGLVFTLKDGDKKTSMLQQTFSDFEVQNAREDLDIAL